MAAFSLRLVLAEEVNRPFLENDYGELSFFSVVGNVNLASNRDYNHGAIIRIYMV